MHHVSEAEHPGSLPGGWFLYMVKLIETGLRPALDRALAGQGITAAQYTALSVLRARPGICSSELARRTFVTAQSMAETIAALHRRDLVERRADPRHRRRLQLHLTDDGLRLVAALESSVAAAEQQILAGLNESARMELAGTLRTLRHNLRLLHDTP